MVPRIWSIGKGFIEVHHVVALSSYGEQVLVNVEKDLICLCPTCRRMIHKKKANGDIYTPDELHLIALNAKGTLLS